MDSLQNFDCIGLICRGDRLTVCSMLHANRVGGLLTFVDARDSSQRRLGIQNYASDWLLKVVTDGLAGGLTWARRAEHVGWKAKLFGDFFDDDREQVGGEYCSDSS